ncbi:acyl-CoA dehydrogenase family protein [Saccharopolyspora shandongensis]|uniref:acyl-CoA dehydrogenase family protein n=1 Tax=Saccharopolyspora shandongensis TaxID=418495 RepID=UPI0033DC10D2
MTGELAELGSTIRDFLTEQAPSSRVREIMESESGLDAQTWDRLSRELGVVGLTVPEEFGGADAGFDVAAVVLGELGRALTPVPYLSHLLAVEAILSSSDTALHKELLPEIAAGVRIATIAVAEGTTAQAFRNHRHHRPSSSR